jgi:hypothetical protein
MRKTFSSLMFVLFALASGFVSAMTLPVHHQYVQYQMEANEDVYNYDMHINWHQEPDARPMGYYAQFAFYFANGTVGYMGLQKDNNEGKKAIFSIWDNSGNSRAVPARDVCKRFDHEGNGTMCLQKFEWKAGREYKLRVWRIKDSFNGYSEKWGGWVIDYETGEEFLIGVIEVGNSTGMKGYGGLNGYSIATTENYGSGVVDCKNMPYFGVTWTGPFGNNGNKRATYTNMRYNTGVGDPCTESTNAQSNAINSVTSETGAGVVRTNGDGDNVWAKYDQGFLDQNECLFRWAEKELPGMFNQAVFKHRRLTRSLYGMHYRDYSYNGKGHSIIINSIADRILVGEPGGAMKDLGALSVMKRTAGCS